MFIIKRMKKQKSIIKKDKNIKELLDVGIESVFYHLCLTKFWAISMKCLILKTSI